MRAIPKGIFSIILLSLFVTTICYAASLVDGQWAGKIEGQFDVTVNLKEDNGKVSGTILSDIGEAPLTNGTIVGNDILFKEMSFNGIAVSHIKGKLSGDTINILIGFQDQEMKGTLIRVKK